MKILKIGIIVLLFIFAAVFVSSTFGDETQWRGVRATGSSGDAIIPVNITDSVVQNINLTGGATMLTSPGLPASYIGEFQFRHIQSIGATATSFNFSEITHSNYALRMCEFYMPSAGESAWYTVSRGINTTHFHNISQAYYGASRYCIMDHISNEANSTILTVYTNYSTTSNIYVNCRGYYIS